VVYGVLDAEYIIPNNRIINNHTRKDAGVGLPKLRQTVLEEVGRLKLVNPQVRQLERGQDGLFRQKDGQLAAEDPFVSVRTGMLEGSNVNPVEEMVNMINLQRHYEMQVKLMKQAEDLDMRGNQLLRLI
ncbi:MAG: hypothetical protein NWQ26_02460, partial [Paraglaciecola sp.]|nr:hypothetical protein [Paraglaciecola sp.]